MTQSLADMRKTTRELIRRRGPLKYTVCTGYASKGGFRFALDGKPNALHLVWMEGDPEVVSYTIPDKRIVGAGIESTSATIPDAICVMRSGSIEWREVKTNADADKLKKRHTDQIVAQTSAAQGYGATWRLVTERDLAKHAVVIRNWRRGLAYLWAAEEYDLRPFEYDIKRFIHNNSAASLKQILQLRSNLDEALLIAAFFHLAQTRELDTDLADKPFGFSTIARECVK
jgi:hypothetical protein